MNDSNTLPSSSSSDGSKTPIISQKTPQLGAPISLTPIQGSPNSSRLMENLEREAAKAEAAQELELGKGSEKENKDDYEDGQEVMMRGGPRDPNWVQLVASPESIGGGYSPSSATYPSFPTATSHGGPIYPYSIQTTNIIPQSLTYNNATHPSSSKSPSSPSPQPSTVSLSSRSGSGSGTGRPQPPSRRTSTASSNRSNTNNPYSSPRIAPLSPAEEGISRTNSPAGSRRQSLMIGTASVPIPGAAGAAGTGYGVGAGSGSTSGSGSASASASGSSFVGRQRSSSKSSATSSAGFSGNASGAGGGNTSRRSSGIGLGNSPGGFITTMRQSFSGGMRARPPSTLIPAPGHEADDIPPIEDDESDGSRDREGGMGTIRASLQAQAKPVLKQEAEVMEKVKELPVVVVKDFAYTVGDDRFEGVHPPVVDSRSNSRTPSEAGLGGDLFSSVPSFNLGIGGFGLGRSNSGASNSGGGGKRKSSFGGWSGFSLGGFGWGGLGKSRDRDQLGSGTAASASLDSLGLGHVTKVDTDFSGEDITPSSSFNDEEKYPLGEDRGRSVSGSTEGDAWDGVESEGEEDLGPEPVGRYRAAYAFESLGGHEMSVEEGEVVDVKGRGGGVGWVIAMRLREPKEEGELVEGLVPESYLEPV